ncbi:MAG TPA: hypothetical protein PK113_04830, partial [Bacillota bacterium]|nr:hypothetical protein [Bacillota bacterium]
TVDSLTSDAVSALTDVTILDGFMAVLGSYQGQKTGLASAIAQLTTLVDEMTAFDDDIPVEFNIAISNYLTEVNSRSSLIEDAYQTTINQGFRNIYIATMVAALIGFAVLQFYHSPTNKNEA